MKNIGHNVFDYAYMKLVPDRVYRLFNFVDKMRSLCVLGPRDRDTRSWNYTWICTELRSGRYREGISRNTTIQRIRNSIFRVELKVLIFADSRMDRFHLTLRLGASSWKLLSKSVDCSDTADKENTKRKFQIRWQGKAAPSSISFAFNLKSHFQELRFRYNSSLNVTNFATNFRPLMSTEKSTTCEEVQSIRGSMDTRTTESGQWHLPYNTWPGGFDTFVVIRLWRTSNTEISYGKCCS